MHSIGIVARFGVITVATSLIGSAYAITPDADRMLAGLDAGDSSGSSASSGKRALLLRPTADSTVAAQADATAELKVLGSVSNDSGDWDYVSDGRNNGWIRARAPIPKPAAPVAAKAPAPAPATAAEVNGRALLSRPTPTGEVSAVVAPDAMLATQRTMINESGAWAYVSDGRNSGWIRQEAMPAVAPAAPATPRRMAAGTLRQRPTADSPPAGTIPTGTPIATLSKQQNASGEWAFVSSASASGWLPAAEAAAMPAKPAANPVRIPAAPAASSPSVAAPSKPAPKPAAPAAAEAAPAPLQPGQRRIYAEASSDSAIIGTTESDAEFELLDSEARSDGEWWRVSTNGLSGWLRLAAPTLAPVATPVTTPAVKPASEAPKPVAPQAVAAGPSLELRSRPKRDSSVIARVPADAEILSRSQTTNADGQWSYIETAHGSGWLAGGE